MGVGVFVWIVFLINGPVNSMFWSHRSDVFAMFFVEGSILAQDERWRRA